MNADRHLQEVADLYAQGIGIEVIGLRLRIPRGHVIWLLGRANVPIRPRGRYRGPKLKTLELVRRVRELRAQGLLYKQIAHELGTTEKSLGVLLSTHREVEL